MNTTAMIVAIAVAVALAAAGLAAGRVSKKRGVKTQSMLNVLVCADIPDPCYSNHALPN